MVASGTCSQISPHLGVRDLEMPPLGERTHGSLGEDVEAASAIKIVLHQLKGLLPLSLAHRETPSTWNELKE